MSTATKKLLQFIKIPLVAGAGTFIGLLILTQLVAYQHYLIYRSGQSREMNNAANLAKEKIQTALGNSLSATQTLSFIIKKYGLHNDFDSIAKKIIESDKYIDALELVEGGVITHVYPLKNNEAAIGLNILKDSLRSPEAYKSIEKKQLFFAGPFELKQGGSGIIGRLPIFIDDKFWGFSASLIHLATLINAADISPDNKGNYLYQLSKKNPVTGKEEFFLPHPEFFENETAVAVDVPNGEWKIYVTQKNSESLQALIPFSLLGIVFSLLGGLFANFITRQPYELKKLVDVKSSLLKSSEENYRITLERISDAFVALDTNWCYTFMNHKAGEIFNRDPMQMIGKNIWAEFPEGTGLPFYNAYHKAMKDQTYVYIEEYYTPYNLWFENHIYPSPNGLSVFLRDVTERKKAEHALQQSEKRYRNLIQQIPDAIYTCDAEGRLTIYNKAAVDLWKREPELGKDKWCGASRIFSKNGQLLSPDEYPAAITLRERKTLAGIEIIIERPDGSKRYVLAHPSPLIGENGEITGIVNVLIDITERKIAEREAERERDSSDAIINSLPGVFYLYDENGNFLRWNRHFEVVTGYTHEEISNMHPLDFFDGNEKNLLEEKITEVFSKGQSEVEACFCTKSGAKIPYYFNGHAAKIHGKTCLIGMGIDITTRKKIERDIAVSEENYRYLFHNNPALIFIWDPESLMLLEINETALIEYGYTKVETTGMSITNLVVPEERNKVEAFARNMINKGDKKWRNTLKHVKKNGEVMYMDIASHRITYNNTLAILSLAENVTEKVKIQEQLKKSYDDIRLLNEHLETVREEERAGIAREIHDELGQQLTAIKMDASWISARVNGSNAQMSERLASMMSLIDETVKTIRRIASDLRPGILDDLGLIAAIEWLCTEFEKRTGVKTVIQTNITDIDIDKKIATGIFRVYQEIFTNISRHAKASLVITHIELAGNWFIMSVTDNGIGFNTEEVNTKNTLGLLGMNERINMLNGYLQIDSLPGNGTKILVKIPLTKKT